MDGSQPRVLQKTSRVIFESNPTFLVSCPAAIVPRHSSQFSVNLNGHRASPWSGQEDGGQEYEEPSSSCPLRRRHLRGTINSRADLGACGWISIVLGPGLIWAVTFTRSGAPMHPPAKRPFTCTEAAPSGRSSISK